MKHADLDVAGHGILWATASDDLNADAPAAAERAAALFEARLQEAGEGICLSSLPMLVDEIAGQVAGGDSALEESIAAQLRRRAGLHA